MSSSPQVRKKMTCEDFIKNNRGINNGENLPEKFLRMLYESISGNEIKISSESAAGSAQIHFDQIAMDSMSARAQVLDVSDLGNVFSHLTSILPYAQ